MLQAVLNYKPTIVTRRSIRPLRISELNSETEQRNRGKIDNFIKEKIVDTTTKPSKPPQSDFIPYSDGHLDPHALHELYEDTVHPDGTAVFEQPITDHCIHVELNLPQGEEMKKLKLVLLP